MREFVADNFRIYLQLESLSIMAIDREVPSFNLKVVVRETGLKPDTIRAWERRYGLPQPERTAGGHRLYSQHDIATLKWLIARQHEGLSISRAVELWQALEAEDKDPLVAMPSQPDTMMEPATLSSGSRDILSEMRETWVAACLRFDELRAEGIITEALGTYPVEIVVHEVLQKGISEIGEHWYQGSASVQQEHFASALAMRRVEALLAAAPHPTRSGRIIVACPPGEDHTFGPLLIALTLKRQGWDVLYLGANVPIQNLEETVQDINPDLVIMSAQLLHTAGNLLEAARVAAARGGMVGFGGLVFTRVPALIDHIPGYYLGDDLVQVPQIVQELMVSPPPMPSVELPSAEYIAALDSFRQHHTQVEASIWQMMQSAPIQPAHLEIANTTLSQNILAALKLGDMGLISEDIAWISGLMQNNQLPVDALTFYLRTYGDAVEQYLDEHGALIVEQLGMLAEQV